MGKQPNTQERFPLLPVITGVFVCILVLTPSASSKFIAIGHLSIAGSTLFFPISYIFGDILTEVYGYERSRRIIWIGFAAQVFAAVMYWIIQIWPAASFWNNQSAYEIILGQSWRIALASLSAYFCGEFVNSFIISRMKYAARGRRGLVQGSRFAVSTLFAEFFDSFIFMTVGFAGTLSPYNLIETASTIWVLKSLYEIIVMPLSIRFSNWIKAREGIDVIDDPQDTNYSPFHT